MISEKVSVQNRSGLHAKPASLFVQKANNFKSEIFVRKDATRINAKSIMGVMILSVKQGDEIYIEATGEDEKQATEELKKMIEDKFGLPDEA